MKRISPTKATPVPYSAVRWQRKVVSTASSFTEEQKILFFRSRIDEVFAPAFLEQAREKLRRDGFRRIHILGNRIIVLLRSMGIETIEQLLRRTYQELALIHGMGAVPLALIMDLLALAGFEITMESELGPVEYNALQDAKALASGFGF